MQSFRYPLLCTYALTFLFNNAADIFFKGIAWYSLLVICPLVGLAIAFSIITLLRKQRPSFNSFEDIINSSGAITPFRVWFYLGAVSALFGFVVFMIRGSFVLINATGMAAEFNFLMILGLLVVLTRGGLRWLVPSSAIVVGLGFLLTLLIISNGLPALAANAPVFSWHGNPYASVFGFDVRGIRYFSLILVYVALFLSYPYAEMLFSISKEKSGLGKLLLIALLLSLMSLLGYFGRIFGLDPESVKDITEEYLSMRFANRAFTDGVLWLVTIVVVGFVLAGATTLLHYWKQPLKNISSRWQRSIITYAPLVLIVLFALTRMEVIEWWNLIGIYWFSATFCLGLYITLFHRINEFRQWALFLGSASIVLVVGVLNYFDYFLTLDVLVLFISLSQLVLLLLVFLLTPNLENSKNIPYNNSK